MAKMDGGQLQADVDIDRVLESVDRTRLMGGHQRLRQLLTAPLEHDVRALEERGRAYAEKGARLLAAELDSAWELLAAHEADVLWLIRDPISVGSDRPDQGLPDLAEACRMALFQMWPMTELNTRSSLALMWLNLHRVAVSPLVGLLTPLVYLVVPYAVLCLRGLAAGTTFWQFVSRMARTAAAGFAEGMRAVASGAGGLLHSASILGRWISVVFSLIVYLHGTWSSIDTARTTYAACATIAARVDGCFAFMTQADRVLEAFSSASRSRNLDPIQQPSSSCSRFCGPGKAWMARVRRSLQIAALYESGRDEMGLSDVLRGVYEADAIASICRARADNGWVWAQYVRDEVPTLEMERVVHPCVPRSAAVANDWLLRGQHALLTGPNAGGKSTLMKAALCCVLLAQTLTIAPCQASCRLTPFSNVSSHMNIVDTTGFESLFQAELSRAHGALVACRRCSCQGNGKTLVVMDEMFSSTNPIEGLAASAACASALADPALRTLCIISTHHLYLCRLLAGRFRPFGMPVELDPDTGSVVRYPYRVAKGVCRQFVALELLARAGFDAPLVQAAITIKDSLQALLTNTNAQQTKENGTVYDDNESCGRDRSKIIAPTACTPSAATIARPAPASRLGGAP